MKNYKNLVLPLAFLLITSCKKDDLSTGDIIEDLEISPENVEADGTSIIEVLCVLNTDISSSRGEILLKCDKGVFQENNKQELLKKGTFVDEKLIIKTQIIAPSNPGDGVLKVTAEPSFSEIQEDYIASKTIPVTQSTPSTIKLATNSFYIWTNDFKSEIIVTGTLANAQGKKVSTGNKVAVEAYFPDKRPAGGRFREALLSSNAESKVSAIYTPENLLPNQSIFIKYTALDQNGNKLSVRDSVLIITK